MKVDTGKLQTLIKSLGLTHSELAARAGITRQTLHGLLRAGGVAEVRDRTVKGLVSALRLSDESLLSPDPLGGYRAAVAGEHADLAFRGLGLTVTEPRSIDTVYVPVRVEPLPERAREHEFRSVTGDIDDATAPECEETFLAHCLARRRVLICGEPGSGKTTALRHAAWTYARGLPAAPPYPRQERLPVMVRLADFARARGHDAGATLVRFAVTRTLRDSAPDYWAEVEGHLEQHLERGRCLVLFDGLDEVGFDPEIVAVVRRFVETYGRNQFVLTSRLVGLDDGPWRQLGFAVFKIARWGPDDIRTFVTQWYASWPAAGARGRAERQQRAEELTTAVLGQPGLQGIASNPLMLTILAALHHANAALPRRRVEVYAKIVEVMLEAWEVSKRGTRPGDPLHGVLLEPREFNWLLERLALRMQREGAVLRPRWWVSDFVQQFLRDQLALDGTAVRDQGERVIRYLCERTGLLVERGDGVFGFWHRTFLEFFAARGLLQEVDGGADIVGQLRPFFFHPAWEEVVVHVAAMLAPPRATGLLRAILDDPDPAGRFLRRGQRLALRCLVDGAAVTDRAVLDQVFADGEAIGSSRWLGIAITLINSLKRLRGTRHEADGERMRREIDTGAQRLPDRDYVTLYCSHHDLPKGPRDGAPGTLCKKRLGGRTVELVWPAWEKRVEDPDAWYAEVRRALSDPGTDRRRRLNLISILLDDPDCPDEVWRTIETLLTEDRDADIRAACAAALGEVAETSSRIAQLLCHRLLKDRSNYVRACCATALRWVAPNDMEVRDQLLRLFGSAPDEIRAGAAIGLSHLDFTSPDARPWLDQFLATIASSAVPAAVRTASLWAVSRLVGQAGMAAADRTVQESLESPDPNVQRTALHVLADAIAGGRGNWPPPLRERVEALLMGVSNPCAHLLRDLTSIVAAREIRDGRRLERALEQALTPFLDRITMAFVFGSVARAEQVRDSDIDLMVIGDVRLKELAPGLHSAERILGRPVNPVLYSPQKFREQYREGNPFLLDVVRKEKTFLKGKSDELAELVADRSPD